MFFSVYTLGCKLNQLETEAIVDSFCRAGFTFVPWDRSEHGSAEQSPAEQSPSEQTPVELCPSRQTPAETPSPEPGILVVNTCTVTSMAEQKARRIIRKALREYPAARLIVTGCYAQMERDALALLGSDFPGRLFVVPGEKKDRLLDLPRFLAPGVSGENPPPGALLASWFELNFGTRPRVHDAADGVFRYCPESFSSHSRAFLKIQDGCDRRCAYCRVSLARGKSRSLAAGKVLEALLSLEQRGFAEAVLTGVNISLYRDSGMALPGLLKFLLAETPAIRLRLSSIEPDGLTDDFFEVLADKRVRPHFHLSVQSGSEKILERMGRLYTPDDVVRAAKRLRAVKDDPFLACDIISGFPGETAGEFEKTFALCESIGFAWIHAFPFSPRPGTAAFDFSGRVSERDAAARVRLLAGLARKGRRAYLDRWAGKEVEAVVEAGTGLPQGAAAGVSENYLKIRIDCGNEKVPAPGSLVRCRLLEKTSLYGVDLGALIV